MNNLEDGKPLQIKIRLKRGETTSVWTAEQTARLVQ
jgi:hypothetical protein